MRSTKPRTGLLATVIHRPDSKDVEAAGNVEVNGQEPLTGWIPRRVDSRY
jgi:hypothetical protein